MSPDELNRRIPELKSLGFTYAEIAGTLNLSRKTVLYWANPQERRRRREEAKRRRERGEPTRKQQTLANRAVRQNRNAEKLAAERAESARKQAEKRTLTAIAKRLRMTSKGAAARGLECELGKDDVARLMASGVCQRSGIPFEPAGDFAVSLDRIDNTRGYVAGNVQAVCWIYNRSKGCSTDGAVLAMARAIVAQADMWD